MRHYRTFPCPGTRRFALRVYIMRALCKLRDAAPAHSVRGRSRPRPRAPGPSGRPGSAAGRPPVLQARHHFRSSVASVASIMPGFPARPCSARAGPPFSSVAASPRSPSQLMRGHSRPCPRTPWPWGSALPPALVALARALRRAFARPAGLLGLRCAAPQAIFPRTPSH